jgi:hypothetical protein
MALLRLADQASIQKGEWLDLLSRHAGVGLWDIAIHDGDPAHPRSRWTWSAEFRRLCGFHSEAEFPDAMRSWSERLHPEDAGPTLAALKATMSGGAPFDATYRLKLKSGAWRWFRSTGGVAREPGGRIRRAGGALVDIHEDRQAVAVQAEARARMARELETGMLGVVADLAGAARRLEQDAGTMQSAAEQTSRQSAAAAIAAAVEEQGATTAGIARNIQQVAQGTRAVSSTITDVGASAQRTGEVSGQITGAARDLAGKAGLLRQQVEGFLASLRAA